MLKQKEREHSIRYKKTVESQSPSEYCDCPPCEYGRAHQKHVFSAKTVVGTILLAGVVLIAGCLSNLAHAKEWSNEEIVKAIYKAEGGKKAKKPYGILSISCGSTEDCRRVCLRTVRNNRIRYIRDVKRDGEDYLSYLSRKYAPIGARNDPKGINRYWLANVQYFLKQGSGNV